MTDVGVIERYPDPAHWLDAGVMAICGMCAQVLNRGTQLVSRQAMTIDV